MVIKAKTENLRLNVARKGLIQCRSNCSSGNNDWEKEISDGKAEIWRSKRKGKVKLPDGELIPQPQAQEGRFDEIRRQEMGDFVKKTSSY